MTADFDPSSVTMAADTIHNPAEGRHFMKLRPITRRVRALFGDEVLAESEAALRAVEIGRDFYDPVIYFPRDDVVSTLAPSSAARTRCPLKGEASYFDLVDEGGATKAEKLAWSYERAFDYAARLRGLIAFDPSRATMVEFGRNGDA
ncbi:MAG: DUF427 domain-containing protein [Pseudomonadota bacterium]